MKRIFNGLILLFVYPIKMIKRSKIDNFVGGLLIGAIFSLVVNVITNQLQEIVQKQRILEAIENEIASNMVNADVRIETNKKHENELVDYLNVSIGYSSDIWTQSTEPLQYVAQLEPEIQSQINIYYGLNVKVANSWVNEANKLHDKYQEVCFDEILTRQNNFDRCLALSKMIRGTENIAAEAMVGGGLKLNKIFHPTKDRLNNHLLKFFMGDKSMKVLSS